VFIEQHRSQVDEAGLDGMHHNAAHEHEGEREMKEQPGTRGSGREG
jgi:hypothetical protein